MAKYELKEDDLVDPRGYIIAEFCCETNVQTDVVNRLNSHSDLLAACKAFDLAMCSGSRDEIIEAAIAARAAIAKAEGT
jgi:hypothetical protein